MSFSEIDWNYLNSLIYQVNRITDRDEMREFFLNMLDTFIPCQYSVFCLPDGENHLGYPIHHDRMGTKRKVTDVPGLQTNFVNLRWVFESGLNKVFRFSDYYLKKEAFLNEPFLEYCKLYDIQYFLMIVLSYEFHYEGCVILMRNYENGDFTDVEVRILDILKDHLALRLFQERQREKDDGIVWQEIIHKIVAGIAEKHHLTNRELEVLTLIYEGRQNNEICILLSIAESTMKKHILSIYEKTSLKNRAGLMRLFNETISDKNLQLK